MDEEYVSAVEGVIFPFFGFAYSIDKVQFNYDLNIQTRIDSSRRSVKEA
jgi:hypothetical protein